MPPPSQGTANPQEREDRRIQQDTASETQRRSKSLPRREPRIQKDPFTGVNGGIYSKGEILRNKERRAMADKGQPMGGMTGSFSSVSLNAENARRGQDGRGGGPNSGYGGGPGSHSGQYAARYSESRGGDGVGGNTGSKKSWKEREEELHQGVPAAGYSGHIQGLRQVGIGKPFHEAATIAKKEYNERQRARSGSRDQFYDSRNSGQPSNPHESLQISRQNY